MRSVTPSGPTELKLQCGQTAKVKTLNLLQYRKFGPGFPDRPWTESDEAQAAYEGWIAKILPFVACTIDRDALAQLRAEMEALGVVLPKDDKQVWVAYKLAGNVEDLFSIVRALTPKVD